MEVAARNEYLRIQLAIGVTQSLGSLGRIIGPPSGGFTYARINFYFPFLSAASPWPWRRWGYTPPARDEPQRALRSRS